LAVIMDDKSPMPAAHGPFGIMARLPVGLMARIVRYQIDPATAPWAHAELPRSLRPARLIPGEGIGPGGRDKTLTLRTGPAALLGAIENGR
jgi:hypothetical protein